MHSPHLELHQPRGVTVQDHVLDVLGDFPRVHAYGGHEVLEDVVAVGFLGIWVAEGDLLQVRKENAF